MQRQPAPHPFRNCHGYSHMECISRYGNKEKQDSGTQKKEIAGRGCVANIYQKKIEFTGTVPSSLSLEGGSSGTFKLPPKGNSDSDSTRLDFRLNFGAIGGLTLSIKVPKLKSVSLRSLDSEKFK